METIIEQGELYVVDGPDGTKTLTPEQIAMDVSNFCWETEPPSSSDIPINLYWRPIGYPQIGREYERRDARA